MSGGRTAAHFTYISESTALTATGRRFRFQARFQNRLCAVTINLCQLRGIRLIRYPAHPSLAASRGLAWDEQKWFKKWYNMIGQCEEASGFSGTCLIWMSP